MRRPRPTGGCGGRGRGTPTPDATGSRPGRRTRAVAASRSTRRGTAAASPTTWCSAYLSWWSIEVRPAPFPEGSPMPLPSQWKPGDSAELTRTVSDEDIALFTRISGDRNPLHYDLEAAKASRFGEIVVQGGITSAILNAVVAEKLPGPGTVFLNVNWNFLAPVRPGDASTGRAEVVEARQATPGTTPATP